MAGFVPFRNICANMNCIAFKLILCFNSATSYTRKTLAARWHDYRPKSNLVMIVSPTASVPSFPMYFTIFSAYQIFSVFGWSGFNFQPVESHPAANSSLPQWRVQFFVHSFVISFIHCISI